MLFKDNSRRDRIDDANFSFDTLIKLEFKKEMTHKKENHGNRFLKY